jgi:hypothetical protein
VLLKKLWKIIGNFSYDISGLMEPMENLFIGFHVVCQIIDYTLKLMDALFK